MEILSLTTPGSIPSYRVQKLAFDWPRARIKVVVLDPLGGTVACSYEGETATTLMNQLNTLDLSVQSLHRRILGRLVADGKLPAGTVTGAPD